MRPARRRQLRLSFPRWIAQALADQAAATVVPLEPRHRKQNSLKSPTSNGDALMRKTTIGLLFASILLVGAMSSPALYAEGGHVSSGSMMDHGMMDHGMIGMSRPATI